jgi:hypothetical protein
MDQKIDTVEVLNVYVCVSLFVVVRSCCQVSRVDSSKR